MRNLVAYRLPIEKHNKLLELVRCETFISVLPAEERMNGQSTVDMDQFKYNNNKDGLVRIRHRARVLESNSDWMIPVTSATVGYHSCIQKIYYIIIKVTILK